MLRNEIAVHCLKISVHFASSMVVWAFQQRQCLPYEELTTLQCLFHWELFVVFVCVTTEHSFCSQQTHIRLTQCCCSVGPESQTLAQHYSSIGWTSEVSGFLLLILLSLACKDTRITDGVRDLRSPLVCQWGSVRRVQVIILLEHDKNITNFNNFHHNNTLTQELRV